MRKKNPSLETTLREFVKKRGLRKVAHDLNIDHGSLYRSLRDGSNLKLERIKSLLNYLGYEIRLTKKRTEGRR